MQNIAKFKKLQEFAVKIIETILFSGVMPGNPSERLEKLRWPVMIAKLRKGEEYSNLKTIANFNKIQDIKIFKNNPLSQETIQYPYFKL